MTAHPPVIVRRPHTRTRYTSDPDAIPYRGRYDHAHDRVYLTGTPVLDVLGRHNGLTHTWLEYRCAYVGCRYLLLVLADHAHDLAAAEIQARRPFGAGIIRPIRLDLGALPPEGGALNRQIVQDAIDTLNDRSFR